MFTPGGSARRPRASLPQGWWLRIGLAAIIGSCLALLLVACSGPATPGPETGAGGVTLVPGAAVSALVGPEGGEIAAADPEGGRSYRLRVPAGAFAEPTEITVSPIRSIEGFPLDGGLLGGVELSPEGASLLVPASLEIGLDADRQAVLRAALDRGQAVAGFHYRGGTANAADDLGVGFAEVVADRSTIRLTLGTFSGHGAGAANPQGLANRRCLQSDPYGRADCEITKILARAGLLNSDDEVDDATLGQIATVFRNWLADLGDIIDTATDDAASFRDALAEALQWQSLASDYNFLTDLWYAPGDYLAFEAAQLEDAVFRAYADGLDRANGDCPADGTVEFVIEWIDIHRDTDAAGIPFPPYGGLSALGVSTFCVKFDLVADFSPAQLAEGESGQFSFEIRSLDNLLSTDGQLSWLQPEIVVTPADPSLLSASGSRQGLIAYADVTARRAIPGDAAEGEFDVVLRLFGLQVGYASSTATFDITLDPDATPMAITCSGSPATITNIDDEHENISIRFDGGSTCSVVPDLNSDDDPDVIVGFDSDPGDSGWDASNLSGSGRQTNWSNDREGDQEIPPGTYTLIAQHLPSGRLFAVTFTIEVTLIDGGRDVTMTVRDVTILEGGTE